VKIVQSFGDNFFMKAAMSNSTFECAGDEHSHRGSRRTNSKSEKIKSRLLRQGSVRTHLALLLFAIGMLSAVMGSPALGRGLESAPPRCTVGVRAPAYSSFAWAPNSRVKVYLLIKDFEAEEIAPVLAPIHSWNAVSELTGSQVILEYAGATDEERSCENCLTIMRGPVSATVTRKAVANLRAYAYAGDEQMAHATLIIDPNVKNLMELTDVVAHELGHSFGLLDCYTCSSKSTVMNQFKGFNTPNELPAPTRCDVAQVTANYRQMSTRISAASQARKAQPIDEGEEPIEDDTPNVVGNP
jgi:hypothetical protein